MDATTILLTAAVTPNRAFSVVVSDPLERLRQYRQAFSFWAQMSQTAGFRICVVESTGAAISLFEDCFVGVDSKNWSIIQALPPPDMVMSGKGAVEAFMIDTAIATLVAVNPHQTVYKVTGRLVVDNAPTSLQSMDSRSIIARGLIDRSRFDVRCIGASASLWSDRLSGMSREVNEADHVDLGNVVAYRLACGLIHRQFELRRFPERPRIRGVSGTHGDKYGTIGKKLAERLLVPVDAALAMLSASKSV